MGFCSCINKLFLAVLNFIVFVVGVGVIALASVVLNRSSEYGMLLFDGIFTLPILILIVGILVTLLGFFGCCGAMRENTCMLYTYATIVTVLFVAEIVLGVLIAIYPQEASGYIKDSVRAGFTKYGEEDPSLTRAVDALQHDQKCCGVDSYKDWYDFSYKRVPESCCIEPTACIPSTAADVYNRGCYEAIREDLSGVTFALGITAVILAVVQMVCIIVACGLGRKRAQYV